MSEVVKDMRAKWMRTKLDELGSLSRGRSKHRPRNDPSLYSGQYPFIQTGDIKAANLYITRYEQTYNEQGLAQSKLWSPGTLCITIAANIAETAILGIEACFPDSVVGFVADADRADVRFVKYCIDTMKLQMQSISRGTTQDNLSLEKLLSFDLRVPPLATQRKIASILSAYDDLIELNLRRIAILEEMARLLYREWFVHFRFPGHEHVRMVDSAVGRVPEGWKVKDAAHALLVNPTVGVPKAGLKPFVPMASLSGSSMLIEKVELRSGNSGSKFKNGDTLFARITPCLENGKTAYVQLLSSDNDVALGSTELIVLRSRTLCPEYVYLMARSPEFRDNAIKSMSGATGRQRVQEACFARFLLAHPPPNVISAFSSLLRPKFEMIEALAKTNRTLRRTRDLLLPKLVSAEAGANVPSPCV